MDVQQFLAAFGYIANAPGGVARLREMVLYLAISGKIVQQDLSEEHAEKLLQRIRQHAANVTSKKRGKSIKKIGNNQNSNETNIPPGWVIVELGEVGDWGAGSTPPRNNPLYYGGSIPWFKSGELKSDYITRAEEHISELALRECSLRLNVAGDVLIAMYGANIGQCSIVGIESTTNQAVCACTPYEGVSNRFLLLTLRAKTRYFMGLGAGGAQPNISKEKIITTHIGLPPTEEQSRIVAKVDELMALCDRLEAQQQARRKLQNALRQSTLQAMASATSPHELQAAWTRLADNFGRLFTAPEDVDDLRKAVLDLAVSGYLSNLNEFDESASILKRKILAAKERGIADGSFSRKKHVKPEELEETMLPEHWESITLDEAISTVDAGWSPACLPNPRDDEKKWGILKTTAVQTLRFLPHEHKELPTSLDPRPQYQIEVGDILITRAGPKNRVGICCVVDTAPARLMISDKLIRFHIIGDLINPHFVALCLSAGEPGRIVERLKSGMADSQMNISQDKLRSVTIPLPPIQEQQRILAKVDELMALCDRLEQQSQQAQTVAQHYAHAALNRLTHDAPEDAA